MKNSIHKLLTKEDLATITEAIAGIERHTSAEVRVLLRERRSRKEHQISIEEFAEEEFHKLGMSRTRDRNGILIVILFIERTVRIHADINAHSVIAKEEWERIVTMMTANFSDLKFCNGILLAVREAGMILGKHFPPKTNDINELSNDVVIQ